MAVFSDISYLTIKKVKSQLFFRPKKALFKVYKKDRLGFRSEARPIFHMQNASYERTILLISRWRRRKKATATVMISSGNIKVPL